MKVFRTIILLIAGIVSIGFSIYCFNMDVGEYCSDSMYGGEAFTGIQNASATAARNVKTLTKVVRTGFGSILLVVGFALIALSIPAKKDENNYTSALPTTDGNNETATADKLNEVSTNQEQPQIEEVKA